VTLVPRRLLIGIGWVIASLLLWAIPCNLFTMVVHDLAGRGLIRLTGVDVAYNVVAISGCLIIPATAAVMAMRGKLPETSSLASPSNPKRTSK